MKDSLGAHSRPLSVSHDRRSRLCQHGKEGRVGGGCGGGAAGGTVVGEDRGVGVGGGGVCKRAGVQACMSRL